jgi:hypothetical protein
LGKYILRYYLYAGQAYARVYHTFIITASSNADSGKDILECKSGINSCPREEVRYRDIAYALPFGITYGFLGTPTIYPCSLGTSNSVYLVQRSDTSCRVYKDNKFDDECEKAEGWMTVGRPGCMLTVAMKDFWQNFPKEFEVTPQAAIIHFWPAHNEEATHTAQNTSIRNLYPFWFAHEGKLLDFKMPTEVMIAFLADADRVPKETIADFLKDMTNGKQRSEEDYGLPVANALGLAKTHEMLLYFHTAGWEQAHARSMSRLFQSNPTAVCDPKWVCESGVFGSMAPRDPQKYPAIEHALDETIAGILRQQTHSRDYGMFNFGDAHHGTEGTERRWRSHRIWYNTHQGWPRWPWLQYARSGSKELFDYADRNARHVADVDHCHYTIPELSTNFYMLHDNPGDRPWGKLVGGICDYKGIVHWASGSRLCYNSTADSMLHHYYFTGDERSRSTAMEHGAALLEDGRPYAGREGAGRATSACELYFYTWDNDYLEFLERTIDCILKTQNADGEFSGTWENFSPFLQRYVELTQSRRGMSAMIKWSDSSSIKNESIAINIRSYAYLYSRDIKHLRKAVCSVYNDFVGSQYLGEDTLFRGSGPGADMNMYPSYFLQEVPYYLYAVTRHGAEPEPEPVKSAKIRVFSTEKISGKEMNVCHVRLRQKEDKPFKLEVSLQLSALVDGSQHARDLTNCLAEIAGQGQKPINALCTKTELGYYFHTAFFELAVPEDGVLEYNLRICAPPQKAGLFIPVPFTAGNQDLQEVYVNPQPHAWEIHAFGYRFYFDLPEGTKSFRIGYYNYGFQVFDPGGKVAFRDIYLNCNNPGGGQRWAECPVTGSTKGWSFSFGWNRVGPLECSPAQPQKPFCFSPAPEKYFTPSW